MKKIVIAGATGSGKSTFAKDLSKKLNIFHVELDNLYWLPGWQPRPEQEIRALFSKTTSNEKWIVCGNYPSLKEFTVDRADTIVWLDYSFLFCFWFTLKRSLRRIIKREKCCNGNQETFQRLIFSKNSILLWMITSYRGRNKRYAKMMQDPMYKDKIFIRLKSRKQAQKWLENLVLEK
jgi:adenylate kinase family enzyme